MPVLLAHYYSCPSVTVRTGFSLVPTSVLVSVFADRDGVEQQHRQRYGAAVPLGRAVLRRHNVSALSPTQTSTVQIS